MGKLKYPAAPWQNDCVVIAVETITLVDEAIPLTYSQATVADRKITTTQFHPLAWNRHFTTISQSPSQAELLQALGSARALRQLSLADLNTGQGPLSVCQLVDRVLRAVAMHDDIIVIHDADGRLAALVNAVENWLDADLPPLTIVNTAVLERARQLKLFQRPGEPAGSYYRRIARADGELPDLLSCYRRQERTDEVLPTDRLFPVVATHAIYQQHFGGHLLGSGDASSVTE